MENIESFGYCGIDCDACNKYSKKIRDAAIKFKAGVDSKIKVAESAKIKSRILELKNYEEFYEVLQWFATQVGFNEKDEGYPCYLLRPRMIKEKS